MSTDPDINTTNASEPRVSFEVPPVSGDVENEAIEKKSKRCVSFPEKDQLVTQYFEPANPWHNVAATSRAQLAAEYLESCRRHHTPPIDSVLQQIRDLPESAIGGAVRAPRLTLEECGLQGPAPVDALEAVLRKVQFRRLEIDHAVIDDEGAEAIFDMIEYYESATVLSIIGERQFGIRGWQAASRMIKKSAELSELEVSEGGVEAAHAPVLARALRVHACRLRALALQQANLAGEGLLCLVIALKSNTSLRELRLGDNRLTVADAVQIGSLLRFNTRLQLLDLSNNQIQDAGVGHIADALVEQAVHTPPSAAASPLSPLSPHHAPLIGYESRGLAFLVLWNNQLTRNCAVHLSKALRSSQSLCVLNIGRNALGTECIRALCAGGALVSVGLQAARLGPDAAPALADLIRADTRLQRLDLRDNRLGVAGLQAILTALKDNTVLTQIDLDEPAESSTSVGVGSDTASLARLTRDIRAACAGHEPPAAAHLHRKISLTCHQPSTHQLQHPSAEEERRGRLRSPAPSPAGSPIPAAHHSRFSVTRVTPDREVAECHSPGPRPVYSPAPSRFKVVQVSEPPQIQVHPVSNQPRKSNSRFSVTRNYDTMYNPITPPPSPAPSITIINPHHKDIPIQVDLVTESNKQKDNIEYIPTELSRKSIESTVVKDDTTKMLEEPKIESKSADKVVELKCNDRENVLQVKEPVQTESSFKREDLKSEISVSDPKDANAKNTNKSINSSDNSEAISNSYKDKCEVLSHSESLEDGVVKSETKLVKNCTEVKEKEKVDVQVQVTVNKEVPNIEIFDFRNVDDVNVKREETAMKQIVAITEDLGNVNVKREETAMKQIVAITEDLGNLIQEFKDLTTKSKKVKSDCKQTDVIVNSVDTYNVPVNIIRENVVLKKNKSESSLDSPDLEVSRLMNKKLGGSPFQDSSSSLEISGSSVESLNLIDSQQTQIVKPIKVPESDSELDRRKIAHLILSTESSIDSNTSELTPVNTNLLNMSVSSNESVSPIIFGKSKKIHDSLSSLEASVSSLDSGRHDKVMVTSADSGIEYSLQNPSENKEDNSSNEGTLTNNSSLKETVKKPENYFQETITSPKRTSSLLDVPALKTKALGDRMRKISWVAPSPSFHIPKPEPEKEMKLPSHLEKLLSLFQHPLFSRSASEEEKKSTSNTPPRKDSSLTSSFWSWGSVTEKEKDEKEDKDSLSEATDSTLSERVQVSFIDESFSKKLDSKTPSTDTDNTLSEFQTFQNSEASEASQEEKYRVTESTDDNLVQKNIVLSKADNASSNGNKDVPRTSDNADLKKPNDLNKNYDVNAQAGDNNKNSDDGEKEKPEEQIEILRPRSFAAVLKSSGSENSLDKQNSPETGQPVDKLPSKVIRGIKENISPENTLTSSMTNTKALAQELSEKQVKNQQIVSALWEVTAPILEKNEPKLEDVKAVTDLAPIATIEEVCDENDSIPLDFIDDPKFDEKNTSSDSGVTLESTSDKNYEKVIHSMTKEIEQVDLGKDALSYLIDENQAFGLKERKNDPKPPQGSLAQELQEAEIKEMLDLSPELIIDEAIEVPEVFTAKEVKGLKTSPVIPERAKIIKSNSLEELSQEKDSPKTKTIVFKIPDISSTTPRDIPERRSRLRTRSGSSPKSLPESLNKPCPLSKMDSILSKKKKKVSSLGKMAKDSLLALNMNEEELSEFRRSYKLTSVESLKSLESVSEDANSQSGNSMDSRCRSCLRTSQESLMSLDSISEDCRCTDDCDKPGHSNR